MKTIRKNQKRVTCEICFGQRHLNCTELNIKCLTSTGTCPKCLCTVRPFSNCPSLDMPGVDNSLNVSYVGIPESVVNVLKEHPRHLSLMHLNTQSMVSSFNEFQVLLSQYPIDVIMSETWLKENPALFLYPTTGQYFETVTRWCWSIY